MYYIFDKTKKNNLDEMPVVVFSKTDSVIKYLDGLCQKLLGKTRAQLMQDAADFGFGEDDPKGKAFFSYMSEYIDMGIVRDDGTPIRCNIFTEDEFKSRDYGD